MKPMKMDGAAPFFPEEIIRNILIRLPVKSLLRFRCVCKDWKILFRSESFIADHLHHSTHQNPYLLFQPQRQGKYTSQLYLLDRGMQALEIPSVDLFDDPRFRVVGSSNGLLCVKIDVQDNSVPPLFLCNPATRDVIKLPRNVVDFYCEECHFGFGYSPVDNDYKIVMTCPEPGGHIIGAEVYSLSTGSWKEHFNYMPGTRFDTDATTANGFMFWTGFQFDLNKYYDFDPENPDVNREENETGVIVSFDIASEKFGLVPIPALGNNSSYHLMVYEDKIAIFHHDADATYCMFNLWVMEEPIGASTWERQSWTKIFSSSCIDVGLLFPAIFLGGEFVYNVTELLEFDGSETKCETENGVNTVMFLLNPSTNEIKISSSRGCVQSFAVTYSESMLLSRTANGFITCRSGDWNGGVFNYSESLMPVRKRSELIWLRWEPPQQGWCKLNIGGIASSQRHSKLNIDGIASSKGYSGCGGVIRGDEGEWLGGFSLRLPYCTSQSAKLAAMGIGIKLCWNMGFKKIEVESDDKELVQVINSKHINSKQSLRRMAPLFRMIFHMLTWEWQVSIKHIYRETNSCVDRLAWLDWGDGMKIWDAPPPELFGILREDLSGIGYPRRIPVKPFYHQKKRKPCAGR